MTPSPFLGELLGTMVLIILGNGVVANVVLKDTKGNNGGWIVITAGWAFAVTMGVFVSQAFGGYDAHLNPAVTVAMAIAKNEYSKVVSYITAQMIGAMLGCDYRVVVSFTALRTHRRQRSQAGYFLYRASHSFDGVKFL